MKKLCALLLAACLAAALTGSALSSGTEQTLISRSYLTGAFTQWLNDRLENLAGERARYYYNQRPAAEGMSPWLTAGHFVPLYPQRGEAVLLSAGSGLLWQEGSAAANGPLVDVTLGTELAAGSTLMAGHRYLAPEETMITAASERSVCAAEGMYQSTATGEPPVKPGFTDVAYTSWYYDEVWYVVGRGLFNGTDAARALFSPTNPMNRGMLATVLHRLAGEPEAEYLGMFADVPTDQWYTDGVEWAASMGIVQGITDTTYVPTRNITREQIAVMLYRYAGAFGRDISLRGDLSGFGDRDTVSGYAGDGMSWAVAVGILEGSGGKLNPRGEARRSEVSAMLMRFDQWLGNE